MPRRQTRLRSPESDSHPAWWGRGAPYGETPASLSYTADAIEGGLRDRADGPPEVRDRDDAAALTKWSVVTVARAATYRRNWTTPTHSKQKRETRDTHSLDRRHSPLLRDVIDIKTSISTSDFVLKLAEAVTEEGAARALRDYVVTERLLENFDEALGLIKAALDGHTSKAAYLHGSFGSGKSHFMAVLHALLRGDRSGPTPYWASTSGWARSTNVSCSCHTTCSVRSRWSNAFSADTSATSKRCVRRPRHRRSTGRTRSSRTSGRTGGGWGTRRSSRGLPTPPFLPFPNHGDQEVDGGEEDGQGEWGEPFAWTPALLDTALAAEELDGGEVRLNTIDPETAPELRARLVHDASPIWSPGFAKNAAEDAGVDRADVRRDSADTRDHSQ